MKINLFILIFSFVLLSCTHQDNLGYLNLPTALSGEWEGDQQTESRINFLSYFEYHVSSNQKNISDQWAYFKIFQITPQGEIYVLSKKNYSVQNKMNSDDIMYSYEIIHMNNQPVFSPSGEAWHEIRIYNDVCESYLNHSNIILSEADFNIPAAEHWKRVRPDGGCGYSIFENEPENGVKLYSRPI